MNTIIEKIRAEIERMKETAKLMKLSTYKSGWNSAMNAVLQLLSTLEKDEKPMNSNEGLEEELVKYIGYPEENLDGKWKKKEVEEIVRHFYELGRQSKPKVCDGLEEEFIRYIHEKDAEVSERGESTYAQEDLEDIARHFAEWGAEHLATPAK